MIEWHPFIWLYYHMIGIFLAWCDQYFRARVLGIPTGIIRFSFVVLLWFPGLILWLPLKHLKKNRQR